MNESFAEMAIIEFGEDQAYIEVSPRECRSSSGEYSDNVKDNKKNKIPHIDASQMGELARIGGFILGELKQLQADEIEMSFGIKVIGEGAFFCFAKASAEAQFDVKLTWKNHDDKNSE